MKKILLTALTLLIMVIPAFTQENSAAPKNFVDRLQLTSEQRDALQTFREKRLEMQKHYLRMKLERLELNSLLKDPKASESSIREQLKKFNGTMNTLQQAKIDNYLELRRVLTAEQFQRLLSQIGSAKHERFRHHPGGKCFGPRPEGLGLEMHSGGGPHPSMHDFQPGGGTLVPEESDEEGPF